MDKRFWLGMAAYVLPTFPLAFFWHLTVFADRYADLAMLRPDPVIPLGLLTMLVQGVLFNLAFPRLFDTARSRWLASGLRAGLAFGLLAWSFAVLAVAAKYRSASPLEFTILESAFTALQFAIVGPLMALAHRARA